jgi:hypothetical protein
MTASLKQGRVMERGYPSVTRWDTSGLVPSTKQILVPLAESVVDVTAAHNKPKSEGLRLLRS